MPLATLSIDLVAKIAALEDGMAKATRIAEKQAAQIDASFARLRTTAVSIGAAIGSAFAGVSFVSLVRGTADAIDALNDAADATGATIENLSGLEEVARRNGGTLDEVTSILVKFNAGLKEADGKNGVSQALKAIGVDAEKLKQLDPADALVETAKALAQFDDDGNKARVTQELFGKSVREAAPFLKDLAESGKLNATVTRQQAEEAERFNKQLAAFETNIGNAARAIVSELLPALNRMSSELSNGMKAYGSFVDALLDIGLRVDPFKTIDENITATVQLIRSYSKEIEDIQRRQSEGGLLNSLRSSSDEKRLEFLRSEIALLNARERFLRQQQSDDGAGAGRGLVVPGADSSRPSIGNVRFGSDPKAKKQVDDVQAYIDRLMATQVAELNLTAVEKARFDLLDKKLANATESQRAFILELAKGIDLGRQKRVDPFAGDNEGFLDRRFRAQREKEIEDQRTFNELLANTPTAQLERARREFDLLGEAIGKVADPATAQKIREAMEILGEKIDVFPKMASEADAAGKRIENALGDSIFSVLQGKFDGILDMWVQLMLRMATEAASADIMKSLLGKGTGSTGGGGLSNLFSAAMSWLFSANGNVFDERGQVKAFANGGVFGSSTMFGFGDGQLGVLGEAGPEAVMPLRRGRDGKLGVAADSGGTRVSIVQHITVGSGVSRNEVMSAMAQAKSAAVAEVYESIRRGRSGFAR